MRSALVALTLLFGSAMTAAHAGTLSCPDLSTAVQVGTCPSEEELRFTFTGYCSDNARAYETDTVTCTDYKHYRRLKNIALWESKDGEFQGYVSCDLPATTIRAARASAISVVKKGGITQVICRYPDDISFAHRTRANCQMDTGAACATDPAACKARCD